MKRLLISAFCFLLSAFHALAAAGTAPVGSGPNVVQLTGNTSGTTLSNTLWNLPNGSTLLLGPGTFTNDTLLATTAGPAPLQLWNKTNISIIGAGWPNTTILSSVTNWSDLLVLSNCNNLRISGITFSGTRPADPQTVNRAVNTCLINARGNNSYIEIDRCAFRNYTGQGVEDIDSNVATAHVNKFWNVHDNYASLIGTTNGSPLRDGTVFYLFPDSIYRGNQIENCNRGFEWQGLQTNSDGHGLLIDGNVIDNAWTLGITSISDSLGAGSTTFYNDLVISGNIISQTNVVAGVPQFNSSTACMDLNGNGNITVIGNKFYGGSSGLTITASGTNTDRINISGNSFSRCFQPINSAVGNSFKQQYLLVNGNSFDNCLDRIEFYASNVTFKNNQMINCGTGNTFWMMRFQSGVSAWDRATNIVVTDNLFQNDVGTAAVGIVVAVPVRNCIIKNNVWGNGITTPVTYESDGELEFNIDKQTTSATPATLLTINMMTNSAAFFRMEANAVSSTAFDALDLSLAATFRNTNGFVSNIVASAVHTFIYTNRTDATWYVDVTNTGTKVLNFVVAGAAGKTVNWRVKCKALLIGN